MSKEPITRATVRRAAAALAAEEDLEGALKAMAGLPGERLELNICKPGGDSNTVTCELPRYVVKAALETALVDLRAELAKLGVAKK